MNQLSIPHLPIDTTAFLILKQQAIHFGTAIYLFLIGFVGQTLRIVENHLKSKLTCRLDTQQKNIRCDALSTPAFGQSTSCCAYRCL